MFGFFGRPQAESPLPIPRRPQFARALPQTQMQQQAQTQTQTIDERESVVLVSREDIYTPDRRQPVLLARKGTEVDPETLARFIRNGARPNQFQVKTEAAPHAPYQTNPLTDARVPRSRKNVIVLDPDQKSMRRLIDCLFHCGFSLNRIRPVRIPGNLAWTVNKYQPQVLIVDYDLNTGLSGLGLVQELDAVSGIEKVILTLANPDKLSPTEQKWLNRVCEENNIAVLPKPVNRHTLALLLDSV